MIEVRQARKEDAPALAAILNPIILRGGTTAYEDEVSAEWALGVVGGPEGPRFCHVAQDGTGRILGFQYVSADAARPDLAIIASFVALDAAGRGVGRALAARTIAECVRRGYSEIDATIRADNAGGLAFYAGLGFRDFATARGVPLKDGTPVDRVSKRLKLPPA